MKKYLLYTLLLVAILLGISATTSRAEETGDLTFKIKLPENYGIYHNIGLGFDLNLYDSNGEPLTGSFPIEKTNAWWASFSGRKNELFII